MTISFLCLPVSSTRSLCLLLCSCVPNLTYLCMWSFSVDMFASVNLPIMCVNVICTYFLYLSTSYFSLFTTIYWYTFVVHSFIYLYLLCVFYTAVQFLRLFVNLNLCFSCSVYPSLFNKKRQRTCSKNKKVKKE